MMGREMPPVDQSPWPDLTRTFEQFNSPLLNCRFIPDGQFEQRLIEGQ
jgi:hypothetical protein